MKEVSAEILSAAEKSWTAVFADLVKARLTTLVLLTTLVGFYLGWRGAMTHALPGSVSCMIDARSAVATRLS